MQCVCKSFLCMFGLSFCCIYTALTSRCHQRVAFQTLGNSESFCKAICSIDPKLWKASFLQSLFTTRHGALWLNHILIIAAEKLCSYLKTLLSSRSIQHASWCLHMTIKNTKTLQVRSEEDIHQTWAFAILAKTTRERNRNTTAYFQQIIKPPKRLTKIAKADCISSHPGGVLGKVFNQQWSRLG